MKNIKNISGFPEYLPEQQQELQKISNQIQKIFEDFCAVPIKTPAIEKLDNLIKKGGVSKEIYTLGRLADNQKNELGLKFDLTVPLARYVSQHFEKLVFPFRRYQIQPVWRGERAQKGRYRQFYQCDFDIIGHEKLSYRYDAEILLILNKIFEELGIKNYSIQFSHRGILKSVLQYLEVTKEHLDTVIRILDKTEKMTTDKLYEELTPYLKKEKFIEFKKLFFSKLNTEDYLNKLSDILASLQNPANLEPAVDEQKQEKNKTDIQEIKKIYKLLKNSAICVEKFSFNLSIVRGLEYYTGIIFETKLQDYPSLGSICSGGRYDNLASFFSKRKLPGVGFSIGLSRLFEVIYTMPQKQTQNKLLIAFMGVEYLMKQFQLADLIRQIGIPTEVFLEDKKILTQIQYAEKKKYRWIAFYASKEAARKEVSLKELQTREQKQVSLANLENYFSSFLNISTFLVLYFAI